MAGTIILSAFVAEVMKALFKGASQGVSGLRDRIKIAETIRSSEIRYRKHLEINFGTIKILSMEQPIHLRDIYIRVNFLSQITANRYVLLDELSSSLRESWLEELEGKGQRRFGLSSGSKSGWDALNSNDKLLVLGKPGSGKTTFLRHILFEYLDGRAPSNLLPIYISLHRIATFKMTIADCIKEEFVRCGIRDEDSFVHDLLGGSRCIILLDGLDEVAAGEQSRVVAEINMLSERYAGNRFVVTCRVSSFNALLTQFAETEIADFLPNESEAFVNKWFSHETWKGAACWDIVKDREYLLELCRTPLLTALVCISYSNKLRLADNRGALYDDAVEALLVTWDVKRSIVRDEVYKDLTIERKKDLLSFVAATSFWNEEFFLDSKQIEAVIAEYYRKVLVTAPTEVVVPSVVLRAIESQHGLLIERARSIHSFSHMTFQEYFVARYLSKSSKPLLEEAVKSHISNPRWREVLLLIPTMVPDSDDYILLFLSQMSQFGFKSVSVDNLRDIHSSSGEHHFTRLKPREGGSLSYIPPRTDIDRDVLRSFIKPEGVNEPTEIEAARAQLSSRKKETIYRLANEITSIAISFFRKEVEYITLYRNSTHHRLDLVTQRASLNREQSILETRRLAINDALDDLAVQPISKEIIADQIIKLKSEGESLEGRLNFITEELRKTNSGILATESIISAIDSKIREIVEQIRTEIRVDVHTSPKSIIRSCLQKALDIFRAEPYYEITENKALLAERLEATIRAGLTVKKDEDYRRLLVLELLIDILAQPIRLSPRIRVTAMQVIAAYLK